MTASRTNPHWTWIVPLAACLAMGLALAWPGALADILAAGMLVAAVIASVHNAEGMVGMVGSGLVSCLSEIANAKKPTCF